MQSKKKSHKIIQLVIVLISAVYLASEVCAELELHSVYPTLGLLDQDLGVTLKGTEFDGNTRVSMSLDAENKKAIVGSVDVPGDFGAFFDLTIVGNYAYVAAWMEGLHVIDISTASNPQIVGSIYTGSAKDVAVSGSYAYVANEHYGLKVIDISNPTDPQPVGSIDTPGGAVGIAVSGNYAYVADRDSLQVINISNPANPQPAGSVPTPGEARDVIVSGTYAYVADYDNGLHVVDISTPSTPQIIKSLSWPYYAESVAISGNYCYLITQGSLLIADISNPADPQQAGSIVIGGYDVTVIGDYAYVAAMSRGLQIIRISTPSYPQIVGSVDTPDTARGIAVSGDYAFVASSYSGLQVVDITDPVSVNFIGSVELNGATRRLAVSGNYAYTTYYTQNEGGGVNVVDIRTPSTPQLITSISTQEYPRGITVSGTYAYVVGYNYTGSYEGNLKVIDISTPSTPQEIGSMEWPAGFGAPESVTVIGDYAYVADFYQGLLVIDISNPVKPQLAGSIDISIDPSYAMDLAVKDSYAYVACRQGGLKVINISNPENPQPAGSVPIPVDPSQFWGVVVSNTYAYVSDPFNGLHVVDISTPTTPTIVTSLPTPGRPNKVTIAGNYANVADGWSGIQVIDIKDPLNPQIIGSVSTIGAAEQVIAIKEIAYVADLTNLIIVPVPIEIQDVTVNNATSISLQIPGPDLAGNYTLKVFNSIQNHELHGAVSFTGNSSILNSKAIIVAGGGPNASGGTIWEETKLCANKAYDALILQGYDHNSIYYISMETLNDYVDSTSPDTFLSDLSDAINIWAADASHLLIYFADHGKEDQFILYADGDSSQTLSAQELDGWLDTLQGTMTGPVTFIYDACQSGSFIFKMRPPEGKERIVITGSSYEPAYFLENGENSFSFHFWDQTLLNEGNLGSSFSNARGIMQSYQSALIEANWDNEGNTNENEDISIADDIVIRRGSSLFIGVHPFVTSVSDPQTLSEDTSATIWASGVIDAESVWALIVPPDVNPETSDIPITDLDAIELKDPDGDHIYEGVYSSFDTEGTYVIVIKAEAAHEIYSYITESMTTQTIYSPAMYTSVTKTSGEPGIKPDSYEEDDSFSQAIVIVLNDDTPQSHNFHDIGDEDWVKFYGLSGETYKIKASSLGITCDVVIELYDSDGTTLVAGPQNDAGAGGDEFLEWLCPQDGIYYVKISNFNTNFGENTKYDLKVYIPIGPITGWIWGTIKNKCTGESIVEAMIKTNNGRSAISLSNGTYLIIHEAGTFTVTAEASGYTPVSYPDIEVSEAGTTIQDFEMTSLDDSDGDCYPNGSDAFPNDPNEWLDTDSDGIGNNADPDDDNDGMPDIWEETYGLDTLVNDADGDLDGDGYTNLREYLAGTDPTDENSHPPKAMPWVHLLLGDD